MKITVPIAAFFIFFFSGKEFRDRSNNDLKINPASVGDVNLCSNIHQVKYPFLKDSTFAGDGFYFIGKYFLANNNDTILAEVSLNDSITIMGLYAKSKGIKTKEGIHIGSDLKDLAVQVEDLKMINLVYELDDFYFFHEFSDSFIKYEVDNKSRGMIQRLFPDDNPEYLKNRKDILGKIKNGEITGKVKRIGVVKKNYCK